MLQTWGDGALSVSGRGAVRDPQEARGSSQDLPPKGHSGLGGFFQLYCFIYYTDVL